MINRVVLVGRITKDAETKKTQSGLSVCSFCIAVEKKDGTDFIDCVAWRQAADFMGQFVKKGDLIAVDGRLQTRQWERDGHKSKATEVIADSVRRLTPKNVENTAKKEPRLETAEMPSWSEEEIEERLPF